MVLRIALLLWCLLLTSTAAALGEGRLRGSGGVQSIDGSAGSGLVPWAVIAGHGEEREWDLVAGVALARFNDVDLRAGSLAVAYGTRLELSAARLSLGLDSVAASRFGFPQRIDVDVLGAKMRLAGDLIYGPAGQLALGVQWRRSRDSELPRALASGRHGSDAYLSWSRLWIDGLAGRQTVANLTVRSTSAHQLGLLGFSAQRSLLLEGSAGIYVHPNWLLGVEHRSKPDRIAFVTEDHWRGVYLAWMPSRHWHAALAGVDLGRIGELGRQRGIYFSVQGSP